MPTIDAISPTAQVLGYKVQINGSNLSSITSVKFGPSAALRFTIVSDTQIDAYAPNDSTGKISVSNGVTSAQSTESFHLRYLILSSDSWNLTFGSTPVGTAINATLTVINNSNRAITYSHSLSSGDFTYAGGLFPGTGGTCAPFQSASTSVLSANSRCTIVLSFRPLTTGESIQRSYISYADPMDQSHTMSVNSRLIGIGVGVAPTPTPRPSPTATPAPSPTPTGAAGTISAIRIHRDGWYAEVDINGFVPGGKADYGFEEDDVPETIDSDPAKAKVVFTVTSQGYSPTGVLGRITRQIYGVKSMRKPFPANSQNDRSVLDEVNAGGKLTLKIVLSDFIYTDDKNGGPDTSGVDVRVSIPAGWYTDSGSGGTGLPSKTTSGLIANNGSNLVYPKVVGRWAWPGWERVTGNFLVESVAFHRFAQNLSQVAAVVYTANDQSGNSSMATVASMTKSTRPNLPNVPNIVQVYAANLDVAALNQGEVIDVNFKAYPWVGDESSVLDTRIGADGFMQPEERLGPLHLLNDKQGNYGAGYALVSPSGSDTDGRVTFDQAQAEAASPFLTIGAAAAQIKAFHKAKFGRDSASGGVILLAEGNYAYPGTVPQTDLGATMDTWLTIKRASFSTRDRTKIISGTSTLKALRVKIEGVSIGMSLSTQSIKGRDTTDALWIDSCLIDDAIATNTFLGWRGAYATQNEVTALNGGFIANFGSARGPFALVRGNNSSSLLIQSHMYSVLGNNGVVLKFTDKLTASGQTISANSIYAFNTVYNLRDYINLAAVSDVTGVAVVQNIFERTRGTGTDLTGIMVISASGGIGGAASHIIFMHNTFTGERVQWAYNSEGEVPVFKLNWVSKFNYFCHQGSKSDVFKGDSGPNGNRVGNWAIFNAVGAIGNKSSANEFDLDFSGLFSQYGSKQGTLFYAPGFKDDRSRQTGSDLGYGDYQPIQSSTLIDTATAIAPIYQTLPYDLKGNPRYGSPDTGAYEYQPPFSMGVDRLPVGGTVRSYGNEKWRIMKPATGTADAGLQTILPGSDLSQWLDLSVSEWSLTGTRQKVWTETTPSNITNIDHAVSDLLAGAYYQVLVDEILGASITGADCIAGVCRADASGRVAFKFTGNYSGAPRTFKVRASF